MKKLYVYSNPNQMEGYKLLSGASIDDIGHNYTDDVAICYADNLDEAVIKFSKLYSPEALKGNVKEARFNSYGVCICTAY